MSAHPRTSFSLLLVIAIAIPFAGCQASYPESMPDDFRVSLDATACYGTCPVYSLVVSADGSVAFQGKDFVRAPGHRKTTLASEKLGELYQAVVAADFLGLRDRYEASATDLPSVTTTVVMSGRAKAVYHHGSGCNPDFDPAPVELCQLEALLESIPASRGWISSENE